VVPPGGGGPDDEVAPPGLAWSLHLVPGFEARRWELRRRSDDGVTVEVHVLALDEPADAHTLAAAITPLAGPAVAEALVARTGDGASAARPGDGSAPPADGAGRAGPPPSTDGRIALLRQAYELFNAKDVDGFVSYLDPDIVWPDLSGGPTLRGVEAVRSYWRNAFSVVDARVVPHEFLVDDDAVIVVLEREVLDLEGRSMGPVAVVVHRVTFRAGRIAKLSITTSDLETPRHVLDRFRAEQGAGGDVTDD